MGEGIFPGVVALVSPVLFPNSEAKLLVKFGSGFRNPKAWRHGHTHIPSIFPPRWKLPARIWKQKTASAASTSGADVVYNAAIF